MIGKLAARGFSKDSISGVVSALRAEGLQSDERFAESYVHYRLEKGYGPVRIRQELRERGVPDGVIEPCLEEYGSDWQNFIAGVREKKFGKKLPADYKEQARQSRFLQYRGFTGEQISRLFRHSD